MQTFLEILLIITAFVSVIPLINMFKNSNDSKYVCLKYLIFAAAFWTILIFIERVSSSTALVYYANMLGYPLKFLLSFLTFCTIFQYVEKRIPKIVLIVLGTILVGDLVIALSNSSTLWFLELGYTDLVTYNDLYITNNGPLFIYHLLACYITLLTAIAFLFVFLAKHRGVRQYKAVTRMLAICVAVVLVFNLSQLLLFDTNVDLTYISLVFVTYILYEVIYRKDMVFNLRASGRGEILSNMREMYILTDRDKRIIEISPLLLKKYNLKEENVVGIRFELLETKLKENVVLYSDYNVNEEKDEDKDHYHLREKEFKLQGMDDFGHMILLYDETQIYALLRELNKLSNYDTMTGLNNRNYIEHKLEQYNPLSNVGILSLDLNGLKVNNDYLGHERGDYLLKSLANKMKSVFKNVNNKEMARIGGDEFLIIVPDTTKEFVEAKRKELLKECSHNEIDKLISVSIGIAIDKEGNENIYQLIQRADEDMYTMKSKTSKAYVNAIKDYIELHGDYIR